MGGDMLDHDFISQLIGALIIFGSMILIYKKRIKLHQQTKTPTIVDIVMTLKTNSPALAVFFLGFLLAFYPEVHPRPIPTCQTNYFRVEQEVDADLKVDVNAYASASQTTVGTAHHLKIDFPDLPGPNYLPHLVLHAYLTNAEIFKDYEIDKKSAHDGVITLEPVDVQNNSPAPKVQSVPDKKPPGFQGGSR